MQIALDNTFGLTRSVLESPTAVISNRQIRVLYILTPLADTDGMIIALPLTRTCPPLSSQMVIGETS